MLNGGVQAVIDRRDFFQIVLQHLLAIAVADVAVHHAVGHQLRLRNTLFFAVFCLEVVLNGVAVEVVRQGNVDGEMAEQDEAHVALRRAAHRVVKARFREGYALDQRVAVEVPLVLQLLMTLSDVIRFFADFPNSHRRYPFNGDSGC